MIEITTIFICLIFCMSIYLIYVPIRKIYTVYGVLRLTEFEYDALKMSLVRNDSTWLNIICNMCSANYTLTASDVQTLSAALSVDNVISSKTRNRILWKIRDMIKEKNLK